MSVTVAVGRRVVNELSLTTTFLVVVRAAPNQRRLVQ